MPDRKPSEKKPPESKKNRNDEFPEKPPEMFRIFWLRWFQNPLREHCGYDHWNLENDGVRETTRASNHGIME